MRGIYLFSVRRGEDQIATSTPSFPPSLDSLLALPVAGEVASCAPTCGVWTQIVRCEGHCATH